MSIKCGNQNAGLGEHTHESVDEVRTCFAIDGSAVVSPPAPVTNYSNSKRFTTEVPAGRYAVETDIVRFYQIDKPDKSSRWNGWTFVKQLIGAPGHFTELPVRDQAIRREVIRLIEVDVPGAAALFGRKLGRCGRCMSPLTNVQSRAAGYGEFCASEMGWPYPTETEARKALNEYV